MLFNLEEKKFFYQNQLRKLMNSSVFISQPEVKSQIENELPALISQIDKMMLNIELFYDKNNSILLLSPPIDKSINSQYIILNNIIFVIIFSFLISISAVILLIIRRN